ncbi:TonB-dependent receptor [Frateuria aurantia]|uniref:TonB-dependent siderophore receptor n=1 Tax=Frateuria aurantia (strain ATCC 33424 / DSM 6220 / KCTC 2777 / LMG 1558 / NBRC 3245 / NCIMB 13370) TaxID=767434 RepID=H8L0J6_FRAAD|nr:TonB-dependent siderophore receptor [Frateuria aurantia]AFC84622.1 TonB-dependent siderophore receptor [Frateuria aurantia DSM 6220]
MTTDSSPFVRTAPHAVASRRLPSTLAATLCLCGVAHGGELPAGPADTSADTSSNGQDVHSPHHHGKTLQRVDVVADAASYHADHVESVKFAAPIADVPQSILVIPDKVLQDQNVHSLRDALTNNVAGITFAAGEGGGGLGDNLSMRGFQGRDDIYVDGIRDAAQMIRSDDFNLDHLEVIRGSASSYSGAGSVSGVINMATKKPRLENFTRFSLGGGTAANRRATIDVNRILSQDHGIAVRLNAMGNLNNTAGRDSIFNHRWGFAPSIAFGLGTPTRVTLSYLYQKDHNLPDMGILRDPRNITRVRQVPGSRWDGYYGLRNYDRDDSRVNAVTLKVDHDFSDKLVLHNVSRFSDVNRTTEITTNTVHLNTAALPDNLDLAAGTYNAYGPGGVRRQFSTQQVENQTDLIWKQGDESGLHNTLDTGLDFSRLKYAGAQFKNAISQSDRNGLSISDPLGYFAGEPAAMAINKNTSSQQVDKAVYLIDTLVIDPHWQLTGAARFDSWDLQYNNLVGGALQSKTDNLFSWKLGATWKPTDQGSVYLSYSTSKQPPSFDTIATTGSVSGNQLSLAPETANTWELGTKWELLQKRLSLTAAVYQTQMTNALTTDEFGNDYNTNGKQRARGLELTASGQITDWWQLMASYSYIDSKYQSGNDVPVGRALYNTPRNAANIWNTWTLPDNWTIGYGAQYVSARYVTNRPATSLSDGDLASLMLSGHFVQNAMIGYTVNDHVSLQLNLYNLTNKRYFDIAFNARAFVPNVGRWGMLTANFQF